MSRRVLDTLLVVIAPLAAVVGCALIPAQVGVSQSGGPAVGVPAALTGGAANVPGWVAVCQIAGAVGASAAVLLAVFAVWYAWHAEKK
jgi:hypothetical protein